MKLFKHTIFHQYRGLRRENYVLFFGNIVTNMGSMVWPMMTLILDQKMGMSAGNIALLLMVGSIICMPANLLGGRLADKVSKKKIILVGDIVSVTCYIACGLIPLSYATIGLIMFASVFQSIEGPAYSALIADITPTKDREKAYSLLYLGANIGLMVSPTLSGILFKDHLSLAFIISGVAIGCSTLLIWFLVRDITPVEEETEEAIYQKARKGASVWRILWENKAVLLFTIITALYYAAYNQFNFLMPLEMGHIHGDDGALIFGTVTSLNCIIVVIFTPLITGWFKKLRETGKLVVGRALLIAGYLLFILLLGFIPIYYAAIVLFTWGEIFSTLAEGPYESKRVPSSHRGRLTSVLGVTQGILLSLFNVGVGKVYDIAGSLGAWIIVLSAAGLSLLLAIWLIRLDRKKYPMLYLEKKEKGTNQTVEKPKETEQS
ncbi:MAG: MFS transporter [Ruminococcaceae bacterium]|nr:MFS transporter [Oscillospiraceae bacterium]